MTEKVGSSMFNPYKCRLTLMAPSGKGAILEQILTPLTSWVDPSQQVINVEERERDGCCRDGSGSGHSMDKRKQKDYMVTPALSVMMFMKETGPLCVCDVQRTLKRPPWKFHHKVELQQRSFPKAALAKQEFFKLSKDLPLFAACPVPTDQEHLRISMYVHNYPAMVEFYRTVTETEIETSKPEFCIFKLYHQPGLDVQLSLKRSPYLFPVPVECAYVSFNVTNIGLVKTCYDVRHVGNNVYTTRDPDGNFVVLYETDPNVHDDQSMVDSFVNKQGCRVKGVRGGVQENCVKLTDILLNQDDMKSTKSMSEIDSGRYSDLDGVGTEVPVTETVRTFRTPIKVQEVRTPQEEYKSTSGYSNRMVSNTRKCKASDSDGYSSTCSNLTVNIDTSNKEVESTNDSGMLGIVCNSPHAHQNSFKDNSDFLTNRSKTRYIHQRSCANNSEKINYVCKSPSVHRNSSKDNESLDKVCKPQPVCTELQTTEVTNTGAGHYTRTDITPVYI